MKKFSLRTALLRLLSLFLFASLFLSAAAAVDDTGPTYRYENDYALQFGTVCFTPLLRQESIVPFYYSDGFFSATPEEYSPQLASLAVALAASASHSVSRYAEETLQDLGFLEICANAEFRNGSSRADSIGFLMAHKPLLYADGSKTGAELLVVLIRSAGYESEWSSNFYLGQDGDAKGFSDAAQTVFAAVKDYVSARLSDVEQRGNLKYFVCGHSRGGAVANLLSKALIDAERAERSDAPNAVYGYPSAAPLCAASAGNYPSIHNLINTADLVTRVAPAAFGFFRCGSDHEITASPDDLTFQSRLQRLSPNEAYPDQFSAAYLNLDLEQGISALRNALRHSSFDTLFPTYPEEEQPSFAEYLEDFTNHVLGVWNSGRNTGYAERRFSEGTVTLETAICNFLRLYHEMSGEDLAQLADCLSVLPERVEKFGFWDSLRALALVQHIPKWYSCSVEYRAADIRFLWSVLSSCEKDGHSLQTIFGEAYELVEADFPVLTDYLLETLSMDYRQLYSEETPIHRVSRPLYLFATVIYNLVKQEGSLFYPHAPGAYMAALQNEDILYQNPILMVNDQPVGRIDDTTCWLLAEYDAQGRLLSVSSVTTAETRFTLPSGSEARLFCVNSSGMPVFPKALILSTLRVI